MTQFLLRRFVPNFSDTKNPAVRTAYGRLAGIVGICCNVVLCVGKLIVGTLSGSIAIMADGINNLSDASSSIITLLGFKLSSRPADREHPYGHARYEYLAGLLVALMIMVIGVELAKSSIAKILQPEPVSFSVVTGLVLAASVAVKLWMMFFNRRMGRSIDSATLEATAMDSRNDVITTSAVLAASLAAVVTGVNLDGWMGLAVALFILWSGFGIVKDTIDPLLGEGPSEELSHTIAQKILSYDGVLGTHDLMVHDYGPGRRFCSAHVEMDAAQDPLKSHNIIDRIERDFKQKEGLELVLHYDPILVGNPLVDSMRARVAAMLKEISPALSMHDFRMVAGPIHTNLIFDVLVPVGFALSDAQLRERIQEGAQRWSETDETQYFTVVTVDRNYAPVHDAVTEGAKSDEV